MGTIAREILSINDGEIEIPSTSHKISLQVNHHLQAFPWLGLH